MNDRIKGFRDPGYFRDPADGAEYLLFVGSAGWLDAIFDGVIGAARREGDRWVLTPPLIEAVGTNSEMERPHIVVADGRYYLFWSTQAMDTVLASQLLKVPTLIVGGLWDQEDIYGAPAVYRALEPKDTANDMVYLSMGPWYHGQEVRDGSALGAIKWDADTAKWWRWHVLAPFLAHYLKSDQPAMDVAPVTMFQSGRNEWQRLDKWPTAQTAGTPLYLKPGGTLGFQAAGGAATTADYISDPATPVSYRVRPTVPTYATGSTWKQWLVDDQRAVSGRPDVLTFTTDALTTPTTIAGVPEVNLTASTSGTDSDWVVKLIDVYP
ncbi:MAG: CocE/NonD family hydrolase, partial [Sphingomonas sp.]